MYIWQTGDYQMQQAPLKKIQLTRQEQSFIQLKRQQYWDIHATIWKNIRAFDKRLYDKTYSINDKKSFQSKVELLLGTMQVYISKLEEEIQTVLERNIAESEQIDDERRKILGSIKNTIYPHKDSQELHKKYIDILNKKSVIYFDYQKVRDERALNECVQMIAKGKDLVEQQKKMFDENPDLEVKVQTIETSNYTGSGNQKSKMNWQQEAQYNLKQNMSQSQEPQIPIDLENMAIQIFAQMNKDNQFGFLQPTFNDLIWHEVKQYSLKMFQFDLTFYKLQMEQIWKEFYSVERSLVQTLIDNDVSIGNAANFLTGKQGIEKSWAYRIQRSYVQDIEQGKKQKRMKKGHLLSHII